MQRRGDNTVRAWGLTAIGTDKPTRQKLKAAAEAAGLTLAAYLRILADSALSGKQLTIMSPGSGGDTSNRIAILSSQAVDISRSMPMTEGKRLAVLSLASKHIRFNDLRHAEILFDTMSGELEAYLAKVESKVGELELKIETA